MITARRFKSRDGVDLIQVDDESGMGFVIEPEAAMDMARIIMDLVCDIRHEQGERGGADQISRG